MTRQSTHRCADESPRTDALGAKRSTSASTVLRAIVSPAMGLSVATLVAAGALSACGETKPTPESAKSTAPVVAGTVASPVESTKPAAPTPSASAEATPTTSASAVASAQASATPSSKIPLPGDYSKPDVPKPGKYGPPPGIVPKPGTIAPPKVGTIVAPGFAPNGAERRPFSVPSAFGHEVRPTRIHRRVTDPDSSASAAWRRGRSLV